MTLVRVHWFCCLLVALWTTRSAALTSIEQDAILNLHNTLRRGEGSSDMQILTWSPTLAIIAQNWSANCNFAHGQGINSSTLSSIGLGQNIYAISIPTINVSAAVMSWFNEKKYYTYSNNTCASGKVCGHYTQVVWADTNRIGCGYTVCPTLSSTSFTNSAFLVCNYAPPGNWVDELPYSTGSACTECSSGQFYCNNGLCDNSCTAPSATCVCAADCKNCGNKTADCRCKCGTGWTDIDCSAVCNDTHPYCNNGWYKSWCDSTHQYVLDYCPKMCGLCVAGTPAPCSSTPAVQITSTTTTTPTSTTPSATKISSTPSLTSPNTTTKPTTATPTTITTQTTAKVTSTPRLTSPNTTTKPTTATPTTITTQTTAKVSSTPRLTSPNTTTKPTTATPTTITTPTTAKVTSTPRLTSPNTTTKPTTATPTTITTPTTAKITPTSKLISPNITTTVTTAKPSSTTANTRPTTTPPITTKPTSQPPVSCPSTWIPRDCYDYLNVGANFSGIYAVWPQGASSPVPVYCDMVSNGGGWTVFQRRQDGSVNFYRGWNEYVKGFGSLTGEFWLGNENIFLLTNNSRQYSLWIQMSDFNSSANYAQYSNFKIASSADKYRISSLGSYTGSAGDALSTTALGSKFSTFDQDYDVWSNGSCAVKSRGAWWYNNCGQANLNGYYYTASQTSNADGVNWYPWTGYTKSLKFTEMKFKPINV